jgi:dTDP-glucose 4,6-dehydratase
MRVLVTGADGFIGTHLCPRLAEQGYTVTGTDRAAADLSIPGEAARVIWRVQPDYVVHLAARYGRILCRDAPHRSVGDNAAATTELAAVCEEMGIPVLYSSSSEVYGDHREDAISEDSPLLTPTTIYGLSKRWGEEALQLYLPPNNLCIARLNMLYGPEQRGGYGCCALATFIRNALEDKPITVHRNTTRSWLYISDAVEALTLLIGRRGIFNVGNTRERLSTEQLAGEVIASVGRGTAHVIDPPPDQIAHKNYVCEKLEALGWEPTVSAREGIAATVEWARDNAIRDYQT